MSEQKEEWVTSYIMPDGELLEMIYRPELNDTRLIAFKDGKKEVLEKIPGDGVDIAPYPASHQLIKKKTVLFPSDIDDSDTESELICIVRGFIHKYLDISEEFEVIATYYVLLSYVFDKLPNVMYLRFLGDFGGGKSRALNVVGGLCYRPIMGTGSISESVLFRIIDKFRGTFIFDEADFNQSDTYAAIIKILNCGYEAGKVVLRNEGDSKKNWQPTAFEVYGPKVIGARFGYKDIALESRCLTEIMGKSMLREDIPTTLPKSFWNESLKIRNKLLAYRFKNFYNEFEFKDMLGKDIEPRLRQLANIMLSVIKDEDARTQITEFIIRYNKQLNSDRAQGYEGMIIKAIYGLKDSSPILVGKVAEEYNRTGEEKYLSPGAIGKILKNKLQINTEHSRVGSIISANSIDRLNNLFKKYGFANETPPTVTDVMDVTLFGGIVSGKTVSDNEITF